MHRLFVASVVLGLAGCASAGLEPARQARNDVAAAEAPNPDARASPALPPGTPVTVVEVEDFNDRTVCEDVTKPGSRIVVGEHCHPVRSAERVHDSRVEDALREQEEITRAARERDLQSQLPVLMRR